MPSAYDGGEQQVDENEIDSGIDVTGKKDWLNVYTSESENAGNPSQRESKTVMTFKHLKALDIIQ